MQENKQSAPGTRGRSTRPARGRAPRPDEAPTVNGYDPGCSCCKLLAHKWVPQIVTVLMSGPHRFSALQKAIAGIGDKVLSARLVELERAGIITRVHYPEIPPRVEYALTQAGLALEGVIAEMDRWSREVAPGMAGSAEAH